MKKMANQKMAPTPREHDPQTQKFNMWDFGTQRTFFDFFWIFY